MSAPRGTWSVPFCIGVAAASFGEWQHSVYAGFFVFYLLMGLHLKSEAH